MSSIRRYALHLAWLVAIIATGGSLYMSEILLWEPCKLCWVQRIFMYPLVLLLGIALTAVTGDFPLHLAAVDYRRLGVHLSLHGAEGSRHGGDFALPDRRALRFRLP